MANGHKGMDRQIDMTENITFSQLFGVDGKYEPVNSAIGTLDCQGRTTKILLPIQCFQFSPASIAAEYPASCEGDCRCYADPHERALVADCVHAGLTQIPKSLPIDTDWLIFHGNNISSLGIVDLQFLHDLSRLDLSNNKIKYISEDLLNI